MVVTYSSFWASIFMKKNPSKFNIIRFLSQSAHPKSKVFLSLLFSRRLGWSVSGCRAEIHRAPQAFHGRLPITGIWGMCFCCVIVIFLLPLFWPGSAVTCAFNKQQSGRADAIMCQRTGGAFIIANRRRVCGSVSQGSGHNSVTAPSFQNTSLSLSVCFGFDSR